MSDHNDQGGVKSPMATIASLRARLAESERMRADDIEILTGDIRRRDAMIDDLRMVMEQTIVKVRTERDHLRQVEHAARSLLYREDFWIAATMLVTLPGEIDNLKDALDRCAPATGDKEGAR